MNLFIASFSQTDYTRNKHLSKGTPGIRRGKQKLNRNKNPTIIPVSQPQHLRRIKAQRLQRLPRSSVRNEKHHLTASDDPALRARLLLVLHLLSQLRRSNGIPLIWVRGFDGESAAESGGGDRSDRWAPGNSAVRVSAGEDGDGGIESGVGQNDGLRRRRRSEDSREDRKREDLRWVVERWGREDHIAA